MIMVTKSQIMMFEKHFLEVTKMWNEPTRKQLDKIPRLGNTENTSFPHKKIWMHFFLDNSEWYIAEFNGEDTFFGYVIINGDLRMSEWGYISFKELKTLAHGPIEVDRSIDWKPKLFINCKRWREAIAGE